MNRWIRTRGNRAIFILLLMVAQSARAEEASILIPKGTTRSGDLVVLGKRIFLEGELGGSAVLVGAAHATVSGRIRRDLVLLGADATILRGAVIDGDVLAVGGSLTFEENSDGHPQVRGRVRTISALEAAVLSELETSPLTRGKSSTLVLSLRLFLLFAWLVVSFGLLFLAPRRLLRAADDVPSRLAFLAALGATAILTAFFSVAFALSILPARPALAVGAILLAALVAAKIFGLTVVFVALGRRITRGAPRGSLLFGDPTALAAGVLLLGLLSLLPVLGPLLWGLSSLAGIGVALDAAVSREPRLVLAAS